MMAGISGWWLGVTAVLDYTFYTVDDKQGGRRGRGSVRSGGETGD